MQEVNAVSVLPGGAAFSKGRRPVGFRKGGPWDSSELFDIMMVRCSFDRLWGRAMVPQEGGLACEADSQDAPGDPVPVAAVWSTR